MGALMVTKAYLDRKRTIDFHDKTVVITGGARGLGLVLARQFAKAGAHVVVPYTRGFGHSRFISSATMRSGQQAARGRDIVELADALQLERPILAGFDWGGNASCVVAALWPERIGGLVSYAG